MYQRFLVTLVTSPSCKEVVNHTSRKIRTKQRAQSKNNKKKHRQWRLHNCGNTTEATYTTPTIYQKKKKKLQSPHSNPPYPAGFPLPSNVCALLKCVSSDVFFQPSIDLLHCLEKTIVFFYRVTKHKRDLGASYNFAFLYFVLSFLFFSFFVEKGVDYVLLFLGTSLLIHIPMLGCSGVWNFGHVHKFSQLFTSFHKFSQHSICHFYVKSCEKL